MKEHELNSKIYPLLLAAALLPAAAATAKPLSYDYIEGQLISSDIEDEDGTGLGIGGSFLLQPSLFLTGSYETVGYDSADFDVMMVGIGGRTPLSLSSPVKLDLYGSFGLENLTIDFDNRFADDYDDSGFGLRGGLRAALSPQLELVGELRFVDYGDIEGQFLRVGIALDLANNLALTADYITGEYDFDGSNGDRDDLRVGIRFNFR